METGKINLCHSGIILGAECRNLLLWSADAGLIGMKYHCSAHKGRKQASPRRLVGMRREDVWAGSLPLALSLPVTLGKSQRVTALEVDPAQEGPKGLLKY